MNRNHLRQTANEAQCGSGVADPEGAWCHLQCDHLLSCSSTAIASPPAAKLPAPRRNPLLLLHFPRHSLRSTTPSHLLTGSPATCRCFSFLSFLVGSSESAFWSVYEAAYVIIRQAFS